MQPTTTLGHHASVVFSISTDAAHYIRAGVKKSKTIRNVNFRIRFVGFIFQNKLYIYIYIFTTKIFLLKDFTRVTTVYPRPDGRHRAFNK